MTDTLAQRLMATAERSDSHKRAAVGLLVWHEGWLNRSSFRKACVMDDGGSAYIRWAKAREYADKVTAGGLDAPRASTSEAAILDLAVAIGEDGFHLTSMGSAHREAITKAVAMAVGATR